MSQVLSYLYPFFVCRLCNKGAGKDAMVKHLQDDHGLKNVEIRGDTIIGEPGQNPLAPIPAGVNVGTPNVAFVNREASALKYRGGKPRNA